MRQSWMRLKQRASAGAVSLSALLGAACTPTSGRPALTIAPMCTISAEVELNVSGFPNNFVAERTADDTAGAPFSPFRAIAGPASTTPTRTVAFFAMNEAWQQQAVGAKVYRSVLTSAPRERSSVGNYSWRVDVQDAATGWGGPFTGSSDTRESTDDPLDILHQRPQFMPVGQATPVMFYCAGSRAIDDSRKTTQLFLAKPPDPTMGDLGNADRIQDLLNGDTIPEPNVSLLGAPTGGNMSPFAPSIGTAGSQVTDPARTAVTCAMLQNGDDVTSRQLHLLVLKDGALLHSMLTDFGEVARLDGSEKRNRFRVISPWVEVQSRLSVDLGEVRSFAAVSRGTALHVFAIAKSKTQEDYRLWHTVLFGSGAWREPKDIWRETGEAFNRQAYDFTVTAGLCPVPGSARWTDASTEIVLTFVGKDFPTQALYSRVVTTPRLWTSSGFPSVYGPRQALDTSAMKPSPFTATFKVLRMAVAARPFPDSAVP